MDAEGLSRAVRRQLGLGRLLPLGDAADGAWLAEKAAVRVLRTAVSRNLPGVRLGTLRLAPAAPEETAAPAVPPPPSALPPGPLRMYAEFEATPHAPLPTMADLLRSTLLSAADRELGLRVRTVDLLVTDLLESGDGHDGDGSRAASRAEFREAARPAGGAAERAEGDRPGGVGEEERPPAPADDPRAAAAAQAVLAVPGVSRLAPVLGPPPGGGPGGAVDVADTAGPDGRLEGRHLRIQLAAAEGSRPLAVARAVRQAAQKAAAWDAERPELEVSVAVVVTAIDPAPRSR